MAQQTWPLQYVFVLGYGQGATVALELARRETLGGVIALQDGLLPEDRGSGAVRSPALLLAEKPEPVLGPLCDHRKVTGELSLQKEAVCRPVMEFIARRYEELSPALQAKQGEEILGPFEPGEVEIHERMDLSELD